MNVGLFLWNVYILRKDSVHRECCFLHQQFSLKPLIKTVHGVSCELNRAIWEIVSGSWCWSRFSFAAVSITDELPFACMNIWNPGQIKLKLKFCVALWPVGTGVVAQRELKAALWTPWMYSSSHRTARWHSRLDASQSINGTQEATFQLCEWKDTSGRVAFSFFLFKCASALCLSAERWKECLCTTKLR